MSEKGLSVLLEVVQHFPSDEIRVFIGQDKNVIDDFSDEIAKACLLHGVDYQIYSPKETILPDNLEDYIVTISWRWMVECKKAKLIVFHDSLLPKYRGFNPLVSMLINGEQEIGVTALHGADNYDVGDVIYQQSVPVHYPIKISVAIRELCKVYASLAGMICLDMKRNRVLPRHPQIEKEASYSLWRDRDDYYIDWHDEASTIRRTVDALGEPYMGAKTKTSVGLVVKINDCIEINDVKIENRKPGKIIFWDDEGPTIVCGRGLLKLIKYHIDAEGNKTKDKNLNFRTRFLSRH